MYKILTPVNVKIDNRPLILPNKIFNNTPYISVTNDFIKFATHKKKYFDIFWVRFFH